jgi:hypothetical protein
MVEGRYLIKDNVVQKISIFSALSGLPSEEEWLKLKFGNLSISALNDVFSSHNNVYCLWINFYAAACVSYIYVYIPLVIYLVCDMYLLSRRII